MNCPSPPEKKPNKEQEQPERGSVFDFDKQSEQGFLSARRSINGDLAPLARKMLERKTNQDHFEEMVELLGEMMEETKKAQLKVSLKSDLKFFQ